jgi:hypothetical protein
VFNQITSLQHLSTGRFHGQNLRMLYARNLLHTVDAWLLEYDLLLSVDCHDHLLLLSRTELDLPHAGLLLWLN